METKLCTGCQQHKPSSAFSKCKRNRNGLQSRCKACRTAYHAAHRAQEKKKKARYFMENRDTILARNARWKAAHPEKSPLYGLTYRLKHREKRLANDRGNHHRHRLANLEAYKAKDRAYVASHRDEVRARNARRRALQAGVESDFSAAQRKEVLEHLGFTCQYCFNQFPAKELTLDHITPLVQGGPDTLHNITIACHSCNSKKYTGAPLCPVQPLLLTLAPPRKHKKAS